eukprot:TRINITY_DN7450_c0_g1_i1.p1 TRINITY_DN7450_c0_g1~~TRINITY_DN7450_c0_g1_i1.p1  ORF type:complete len:194 (+),score=45.96 TRINITY_DN7450_c0_g1_i1:726-1307(+)
MSAPQVFFILGGPGSGKGTNCERLAKELNFRHFSAGDLLRDEGKKDSELGLKIQGILAEGNIVPSEITVALLKAAIDANSDAVGFLIDGFPRKFDQADMFETGIAKARCVIYLECSEKVMEDRLLSRAATGEGRSDDKLEVIRHRFRVNVEQCVPVVERYKADGRCVIIDANRDREVVYSDFRDVFAKLSLIK